MILGKKKVELKNSHDHRGGGSLEMSSAYRLSSTSVRCFSAPGARGDSSYYRYFLVGFDHISLLDVLISFDGKTAFVTGSYLTDIVFESFETAELAFVNHDLISQQPHQTTALDFSFSDIAAGNRARAGNIEDLADFNPPESLLAVGRFQQSFHGRPDIGHHFIDDRVQTHVDAFFGGQCGAF